MAKKVDLNTLTREELLDVVRTLQKRLRKVRLNHSTLRFRHDAALEFFHEMEIFDAYSDWVKMKADALGI